ncbi:hypothetical protein [Polluticoccus soli]|uniref:hypothetical protein n=1 Tax=Polluticoccus soli TaxID=3034150 RepID=UPI0023E33AE8|nr:hypothetical protein [Flavipsychrobacter sp. JY13-12]
MQVQSIKTEQREAIRNRVRDNDRFLQLSLGTQKFERLFDKNENEICLNGTMYDLVSYTTDVDTVRCIVIQDEDESELHRQFSRNIETKPQRTPKPIVFFWPYASHNIATLPVIPFYRPLTPKTPETNDRPSCGYKRFISQPPETIWA